MQVLYLDTNVFLDFLFAREPFFDSSKDIIALGKAGRARLCLSALSVVTTFYIAERHKKDMEKLKATLNELFTFITIVDLTSEDIIGSIKDGWLDFEDSTQYYSAASVDADCIITRNAKDFKMSDIKVCSPQEYLSFTS